MDSNVLESVGFTKGEVKVYLALLKLGETTTGDIIKNSEISGSKVYEILEKLIEKGLVSYSIKEKTKYFLASSPKRLNDYLMKKEEELNSQAKEINNLIPELEKFQKEEETQTSQTFEGYEGIKTVLNLILETLKEGEEYYAFSIGEEIKDKKISLFLKNYHAKRIQKKIKVKIITNEKEKESFKDFSHLKDLEIKYHKNPVPLGVFIFSNYIATFTFKEKPMCFLIRSEQVSNSYKDFFRNIWQT